MIPDHSSGVDRPLEIPVSLVRVQLKLQRFHKHNSVIFVDEAMLSTWLNTSTIGIRSA